MIIKTHFQAAMFAAIAIFSTSCQKDPQEAQPITSPETRSATGQQFATLAVMNSWMTGLPDNTNLARITIPGTHDSGARTEPIGGTAKCQNLSIADQLEAGVRFLDIRCRHIGDAFAIHHGSIYQNLNFTDVLTACLSFLDNHPGETIIMCVKEEYDPTGNTRSFEQTFDSYVATYPGRWHLGAAVPNLGSVRNKIVLLRRFGASSTPKGIDATNWADNTTFTSTTADATLRVQDQYVVPDNNNKWTGVTNLFTEANASTNNTLFINFTSGYKSLIFGIPSITTVSNNINPRINTFFTTNTYGRYGIIPMDFVDATRAQLIVESNF